MELLVISNILLWIAVLAMAAVIYALVRQIGILYERVAPAGALAMNRKLEPGMAAPAVAVRTLQGQDITVGEVGGRRRAQLLFFLAPDCPVCKGLLPALKAAARSEAEWLDVILASDGASLDHQGLVRDNGLEHFPYVLSEALGIRYGVAKLPYAVLIDETGAIAALGIVNSREHLDSLFEAKERKLASIQDYLHKHTPGTEPGREVKHELAG